VPKPEINIEPIKITKIKLKHLLVLIFVVFHNYYTKETKNSITSTSTVL